jgi:hypothetical protein
MDMNLLLLVDLAKYSVGDSLSLFSKYYIFAHMHSQSYKKNISNGIIHYIYIPLQYLQLQGQSNTSEQNITELAR